MLTYLVDYFLLWQSLLPRSLFIAFLILLLSLAGCFSIPLLGQVPSCPDPSADAGNPQAVLKLPQASPHFKVLQQSWLAYQKQFIQADGRVIDREAGDRSTSEGQAYALLRAVLINDRDTFSRVLTWSENNLARTDSSDRRADYLWAWKWGNSGQKWEILDSNFASDADIDAVTALILAARRWDCPGYLTLARTKLNDLWNSSVATVGDRHYLLPGAPQAFWNQPDKLILNPSYFAPYAFRLFAQVDSSHSWMSLIDSSYRVLEISSGLSKVGLPADWIALNPKTGKFSLLPASHRLKSIYSFDAYRVWWRIALDASWYDNPDAKAYLRQHTHYLKQLWQEQQKIPARIDLQGKPIVTYDATSQYAALYAALQLTNPPIAKQVYQRKLMARYRNGFWDNDSAYYSQNLAWFALLPPQMPRAILFRNKVGIRLNQFLVAMQTSLGDLLSFDDRSNVSEAIATIP